MGLAIGGGEVFWNSNKHETVALPAAASANNMLDWDINPKENVNGWRFNIGIPDYETMETYTLYLCLLLMSLNLICGAYFCCCCCCCCWCCCCCCCCWCCCCWCY